jgi:hypothetical protein
MAERLGITDLASAQRSLKTDGLGAPRAGAVISGANLALGAEFFNTLVLRELDGGDRPLSIVAGDGNSQAVKFVKPDVLHRSGLSIHQNDGLADKFGLRLFEGAEDGRRAELHNGHGRLRSQALVVCADAVFAPKGAQLVTG